MHDGTFDRQPLEGSDSGPVQDYDVEFLSRLVRLQGRDFKRADVLARECRSAFSDNRLRPVDSGVVLNLLAK